MAQAAPVATDSVRELRLALVCYRGVSLAIYMHGTTKEIHKTRSRLLRLRTGPGRQPVHQERRPYRGGVLVDADGTDYIAAVRASW